MTAAALTSAAIPALASEPESGTVSTASPKVEWAGESTGYGVYPLHSVAGSEAPDRPCEQPYCDSFALTVADSSNLSLQADNTAVNGPGGDFVELDVVKPDGSVQYTQSGQDQPASVKIKNAPKGDYEIRVWTNERAGSDGSFTASATLGTVTAAPGPQQPSSPQQPQQVAPQQPAQPQPSPTISLVTKKLSARKAKRAPKVTIKSSGPVTQVVAALSKGKKKIGTAKRASLNGAAALKFKAKKKLKKGTYTLVVNAKDAQGRAIGLRAKLKVTR